ncbi:hypothetical protein T440DRAFT_470137 [Plenodomus tracheiphilus IPT5]|uniref:Calcineurin-like phosphoesterase domain-containing protein n=1 Tax=Plenodomus tracheiphilus IPT5 TaxID=1408161 RepID=A0A6A7AZ11_9PLEO|nr:hypothetical protein T440DRAFT_470137 [Plenodomus tracheiphilus IPT5]
MQFSRFLLRIALLILPIALVSTTWLYLYPIFHSCGFPTPPPSTYGPRLAPFRLLSLGDPQLEGDSSLPDPEALVFPSLEFFTQHLLESDTWAQRGNVLTKAGRGVVIETGRWLEGKRKAVDLWGNDLYLAHIVRSLRWATEPTHIAVLGDLLGSQWVTNGEFRKRAGRYWGVVMRGLENVPDRVFGIQPVDEAKDDQEQKAKEEEEEVEKGSDGQEEGTTYGEDSNKERKTAWGGTTEVLGADPAWNKRVINIAGNHDVGYAGDLDESRIERFERAFGSVNWDIWFELPVHLRPNNTHADEPPPALRLVILNTMNLDTPAWSADLQTETYSFTNHIITHSRPVHDTTHATVLLTHIPLEKEQGICVDAPYFDFFEDGQGVKEQNMLSDHASRIVLEGMFGMSGNKDAEGRGMGRRGVVINGHDHAGCDVVHYIRQPGVDSTCSADEIVKKDAYWPVPTAEKNVSMPPLDADTSASPNDTDTAIPHPPTSEPDPEFSKWRARRYPHLPFDISPSNHCLAIDEAPHIREITLRSMMGEFSGYAGFLSAWFDGQKGDKGEWVLEFATCGIGIQHWWWGVHVLDLILVVSLVAWGVARAVETVGGEKQVGKETRANGTQKSGVPTKDTRGLVDAKDMKDVRSGDAIGKA